MTKEDTSTRLKTIMKELNLRQVDILEKAKPLCKKYNVKLNKSDLSQYVSGLVTPGQDKLAILGEALNVNEAWLMGYDVPRERKPIANIDLNDIEALRERYDNKLEDGFIDLDKVLIFVDKNKEFNRLRKELISSHYESMNPVGQESLIKIIYFLKQLNTSGQQEATKRVEELTYIDKYINTKPSKIFELQHAAEQSGDYLTLNAAHKIEGASSEDKQHDEDIMNDDNF